LTKTKQSSTWILIAILVIAVIAGCLYMWNRKGLVTIATPISSIPYPQATPAAENPNFRSVSLACADNSTMLLTYYTPEGSDPLTNLSVAVFQNGYKTEYEMILAESASGARYATADDAYSIWEAKGTFTFYDGEEAVTDCTMTTVND